MIGLVLMKSKVPHKGLRVYAVLMLGLLAVVASFGFWMSRVPRVQAASLDLTGSCPGGVGDVADLIVALNNANSTGEADTITLAAGCVYTLTAVDNSADGSNGLPAITSAITIDGNGATIQRDKTSPYFRIFYIESAGSLTLNDLTVRYGVADNGAGIYNNGLLSLNNATITLNTATYVSNGKGGGIYNALPGQVIIVDSVISQNAAVGGMYDDPGGGGLANYGAVISITNSTFMSNTCEQGYGGGGLYAGNGTIDVIGSVFRDNSGYEGGGIATRMDAGFAVLNVSNSTFSGNRATGDWGSGGGISSNGGLLITGTTFVNNAAVGTHGDGGAVAHINASAVIANSTFSGNSACANGGAIYYRNDYDLIMQNVTIASNTADSDSDDNGDGGGFYTANMWGMGTIPVANIGNTIIAGNLDGSSSGGNIAPDCYWQLNSEGNNLIQDMTGCTFVVSNNDLTGVDPLLAALADNGGATQTHALLEGSPAIDAGLASICSNQLVNNLDQRGVARPQGTGCDIGAFEAQLPTTWVSYLPCVFRQVPWLWPIFIGDAIAIRDIEGSGQVFYQTTIQVPVLPAGGQFFLSAQPETTAQAFVDDAVIFVVDGVQVFRYSFADEDFGIQGIIPQTIEIPRSVMEQMTGRDVTVLYQDIYGYEVGASEMWLLWRP